MKGTLASSEIESIKKELIAIPNKINELLKNKTINEAIKQMKLKNCMSPRFLPVFFIKLGMRHLARLMFRLRSWSNYRKEK